MEMGIIELLGIEEEDSQIACGIDILQKVEQNPDYPQFAHCELDPSFLLSLNSGLIPLANQNLATKTLYQSKYAFQGYLGASHIHFSIPQGLKEALMVYINGSTFFRKIRRDMLCSESLMMKGILILS